MQVQLHKTESEIPHVGRGCYTAPLQALRGWLDISTSDGHFSLHNLDPAQMIALGERIADAGRRFEADLLSRPRYQPRVVQGASSLEQGPPFDPDPETRCRICKDVTDAEELSPNGECVACHLTSMASTPT